MAVSPNYELLSTGRVTIHQQTRASTYLYDLVDGQKQSPSIMLYDVDAGWTERNQATALGLKAVPAIRGGARSKNKCFVSFNIAASNKKLDK
jgi:hypothetical protein